MVPGIWQPVRKNISTPAYNQIRQMIIRNLRNGSWDPAVALPSEKSLCELCGVSRITVRRAIGDLVKEGLLYTVPGKGVFVAREFGDLDMEQVGSFFAAARQRGVDAAIRVLEQGLVQADAELADRLGVAEGTEVIRILRIKMVAGAPIFTEERYVPHALCPGFLERDLAGESLTRVFREIYPVRLARRELLINPLILDERAAAWLAGTAGQCALLVNETLYLENGGIAKWEQRMHKSGLHLRSKTTLYE